MFGADVIHVESPETPRPHPVQHHQGHVRGRVVGVVTALPWTECEQALAGAGPVVARGTRRDAAPRRPSGCLSGELQPAGRGVVGHGLPGACRGESAHHHAARSRVGHQRSVERPHRLRPDDGDGRRARVDDRLARRRAGDPERSDGSDRRQPRIHRAHDGARTSAAHGGGRARRGADDRRCAQPRRAASYRVLGLRQTAGTHRQPFLACCTAGGVSVC